MTDFFFPNFNFMGWLSFLNFLLENYKNISSFYQRQMLLILIGASVKKTKSRQNFSEN